MNFAGVDVAGQLKLRVVAPAIHQAVARVDRAGMRHACLDRLVSIATAHQLGTSCRGNAQRCAELAEEVVAPAEHVLGGGNSTGMREVRIDRNEICRDAEIVEGGNPPLGMFRQRAERRVSGRKRAVLTPTPRFAVRVDGAGVIATRGERAEFADLACRALHGDRHQAAIAKATGRTRRSELAGEIVAPAADLVGDGERAGVILADCHVLVLRAMVGRRPFETRLRLHLQAQGDGFLLARRLPFEDAQRIEEAGVFDLRKTVGQLPLEILGRERHSTIRIQQRDPQLQIVVRRCPRYPPSAADCRSVRRAAPATRGLRAARGTRS